MKCVSAPAIFPNNDVNHHMNKLRAKRFAMRTEQNIVYAVAKDAPSLQALQERPALGLDKLKWLQRHDRESGNLYGMLPLVKDMPMALTDHIDRHPEKQLLRGKIGRAHSWVLALGEASGTQDGCRMLQRLPVVVFLKFPNAAWKLDGIDEAGVYPIRPKTEPWFLDKGRTHPVIRIIRKPLPIVTAFAINAHASQRAILRCSDY